MTWVGNNPRFVIVRIFFLSFSFWKLKYILEEATMLLFCVFLSRYVGVMYLNVFCSTVSFITYSVGSAVGSATIEYAILFPNSDCFRTLVYEIYSYLDHKITNYVKSRSYEIRDLEKGSFCLQIPKFGVIKSQKT